VSLAAIGVQADPQEARWSPAATYFEVYWTVWAQREPFLFGSKNSVVCGGTNKRTK
jgi:hypothetical protein